MIGIYSITNHVNGKRYVGQSRKVEARISKHQKALIGGYHDNKHLQSAYNKYGAGNFSFDVLRECSFDELDSWERIFVRHFDSMANGYNKDSGGNLQKTFSAEMLRNMSLSHIGKPSKLKGIPKSAETKRKLSEANKGKVQSAETIRKKSEAMKGKKRSPQFVAEFIKRVTGNKWNVGRHCSDETKQKLSKAHKGRVFTEETKRKMSKAKMGNQYMLGKKPGPLSEEGRRKISETHKGNKYRQGKTFTEETLKKISDALKGRVFTEEHRRKIGEANKKRVVSAETRKKISETLKAKVKE
jgi:group I intron endonuclease